MANLVRPKLRIIVSSIILFISVQAIKSNFFQEPTIKKWNSHDPLNWSDFNGMVPYPTKYGAAISSKIYTEYDSVNSRFIAYAGQNDQRSWVKSSTPSDYGLQHEQYHFNITEYFARKLSRIIEENPDISEKRIKRELKYLREDQGQMQMLYDNETDHSLERDQQRIWEFKIDSMLMAYDDSRGVFFDPFSTLTAKLPDVPEFTDDYEPNYLASTFYLEKYEMGFSFLTKYDNFIHTPSFEGAVKSSFENRGYTNIKTDTSRVGRKFFLEMQFDDTTNQRAFHTKVYYEYPYEYQISVYVPLSEKDNLAFSYIRNIFFENVRFVPKNQYWVNYAIAKKSRLKDVTSQGEPAKNFSHIVLCRHYKTDYSIYYHKPIPSQDSIYIPFRIVKYKQEEIDDIMLAINDDKIFSQKPEGSIQVIRFHRNLLDSGKNLIQFGYTIKADSTEACYKMRGSLIEFESQ